MCNDCQKTFGKKVGLPKTVPPVPDEKLVRNSWDIACDICAGSPAAKRPIGGELCDSCFDTNYFQCPHCEEWRNKADDDVEGTDETTPVWYCGECYREVYARCVRCDCELTRDVDTIHNPSCGRWEGDDVCESCYEEVYSRCDDCEEELDILDRYTNANEDDYCESCYNRNYFSCVRCNEETPRDESHTSESGDDYCESCYGSQFTTCDDCGEELRVDDVFHRGGGDYCEGCAPDEEDDDSGDCSCEDCSRQRRQRRERETAQTAAAAPAFTGPNTFERIGSKRIFSVELETSKCDNYRTVRNGHTFQDKDDGSITGREFVLSCATGDAGLAEIDRFCELADDNGFAVDTNCGFHAHFDATSLTLEQRQRVAIAYLLTAKVWMRFVSDSRAQNSYCRRIGWTEEEILSIRNDDAWFTFCDNQDRYQWFNLNAYYRHKTFEIRLHSATLAADKVNNWVKAHCRFIDAVAEMSLDDIRAKFDGCDVDATFTAMAETWNDSALTAFYEKRSALFGKPVTAQAETSQAETSQAAACAA